MTTHQLIIAGVTDLRDIQWYPSMSCELIAECDVSGWRGDVCENGHALTRGPDARVQVVDEELHVTLLAPSKHSGSVDVYIPAEVIGACLAAMSSDDRARFLELLGAVRPLEEMDRG